MGIVHHTLLNGRFVQIQDGFRSKEMLGPILGTFPEAALAMECIWLPVHISGKGQAKQTKTSLFWQVNAIHLCRHQKRDFYGN